MTGNGTQYAVVFGLMVYLAHVLTPKDFGLMATVSVGLDIGTRIARWGQVELLQQDRYQTDAARNRALRLSLGIAFLFALGFALSAYPLADYFMAPELAVMLLLCAPVFFFSAAGAPAEAVLRSRFRFKVLAFRSSIATLIGAAVAILLANMDYGALALAGQRLVQAAVSAVWIWTAVDWRPQIFGRLDPAPGLRQEGQDVMVGTLLPLLVPRSIDLIVGFLMGPAMLGLMRVAFRVNDFVGQLVVMPLVSVANAELSSQTGDLAKMRQSYLRLTQASALLMSPALVGLSLVASEAIPVIFGPQWTGAVPFVEVIGLLALVAPINYYFAPTMVALSQSKRVLRQGVFQIILGISLAAIAAQISLLAIAVAHVVRGTVVALTNMFDLRRQLKLPVRDLAKAMAPPYLGCLAMVAVVIGLRAGGLESWSVVPRWLMLGASGLLAYVVTLRLIAALGWWPDYHALTKKLLKKAG